MVDLNEAIVVAKKALTRAHAPYINYKVGAALVCKNDKIYSGCNVENHGIMSICAERVAFSKAISDGVLESDKSFVGIAVVGGKDANVSKEKGFADYTTPCGVCLQFMSEFVDAENFFVISAKSESDYWIYTLKDLMPFAFKYKK
jgi:cytidine deaminase